MSSSSSSNEHRVDLPTDVLYEIFSRFPSLKPVYKFRCVSWLWKYLLSDSSFMNKTFNRITSIPWIFMYDPSNLRIPLYLNHNHGFITHHDGLSFKFLLDTRPFRKTKKICLLDSCSNGLVLCSRHIIQKKQSRLYCPPRINIRARYFYICNPLTKRWVSLPQRPDISGEYDYWHAKLVCESSEVSLGDSICNYKVVYIYSQGSDNNVFLQIFSSDTGKWNTSRVPRHREECRHLFQMAIHHGVMYLVDQIVISRYTVTYRVTAFGLENKEKGSAQCRSIDYPSDTDEYKRASFFGESEGCIYYGYIVLNDSFRYKASLSVWLLEDDGGGLNWQMLHSGIELKGYTASSKVEAMYINPVDRNVIIIEDQGCCLSYNITTLTHEVLRGCPIPTPIRKKNLPPLIITPKPTVIPSFKTIH